MQNTTIYINVDLAFRDQKGRLDILKTDDDGGLWLVGGGIGGSNEKSFNTSLWNLVFVEKKSILMEFIIFSNYQFTVDNYRACYNRLMIDEHA